MAPRLVRVPLATRPRLVFSRLTRFLTSRFPARTADPQARALQEEFLRLQQQFLTWQLHAAAQQSAGIQLQQATLAQPMAMAAVSQTTCPADQSPAVFAEDKREEPVVQHRTPLVHDEAPVECSEAPVVQSEPVKVPAQMEPPVEEKAKS